MPLMTVRDTDIRDLVALALEIGELRVKLNAAQSRIQQHSPVSAIDEAAENVVATALRSERELASIGASILRRIDGEGAAAVLAQPLNRYEAAHFEMARQHAEAIDDFCSPRD